MSSTLSDCLVTARANIAATYELDDEILENIYQIVVKACDQFLKAKPTSGGASKSTAEKGPRLKTAYNMFVREQFRIKKEENKDSNSQAIMSAVSGQWAKLTPDAKATYVKMAEEANATAATEGAAEPKAKASKAAPKGKAAGSKQRRITGYNLFYRENKDRIKESHAEGVSTMAAVGQAWKDLSDAERTNYNERAVAETEASATA